MGWGREEWDFRGCTVIHRKKWKLPLVMQRLREKKWHRRIGRSVGRQNSEGQKEYRRVRKKNSYYFSLSIMIIVAFSRAARPDAPSSSLPLLLPDQPIFNFYFFPSALPFSSHLSGCDDDARASTARGKGVEMAAKEGGKKRRGEKSPNICLT